MIETLLLTTTRVSTFCGTQGLTGASGFFFQRDERLYLVTNRHVVIDRPSGHVPDRIEIEMHTDAENLTNAAALSVLRAFTPRHLQHRLREVEVGTPLLVVGFPLGFHDTLHHLPVARQAVIASSFGLRFQGQGYFLGVGFERALPLGRRGGDGGAVAADPVGEGVFINVAGGHG